MRVKNALAATVLVLKVVFATVECDGNGRNGNNQESRRVSVGSADPPQGLSSPAQNLQNLSRRPSLGTPDRKRNGPWRFRLPNRGGAHRGGCPATKELPDSLPIPA